MAPPYNKDTSAPTLVHDLASHIQGKTVLISGPTLGSIGGTFALSIAAAQPALLILAGRSAPKLQATADALAPTGVAVKQVHVDFGSMASVRAAAATVNAWPEVPAIDVLVNNAGVMAVPWARTPDGFETQWATNYLGPWLWTNLLMPKVLACRGRVVSVSSDGHRLSGVRWADLDSPGIDE